MVDYGDDVILRGLKWSIDDGPKGWALAQKVLDHKVAAQEIISELEPIGIWWGLTSQYGGLGEYESHAESDLGAPLAEMVRDAQEEAVERGESPADRWFGGEVAVVLVAKRPEVKTPRGLEPWDPDRHNPPGTLFSGNSFLPGGFRLEVIEVRYDAQDGTGYHSLKVPGGIRTTAGAEEWVRYHGTSASAAREILRDGARSGLNLTSSPDHARMYARYASGGTAWTTDKRKQGVVLEVRVRPEETEPGSYASTGNVPDHVVTVVPLPADRIRVAGEKTGGPQAETPCRLEANLPSHAIPDLARPRRTSTYLAQPNLAMASVDDHWRPTKGMFAPGRESLDPRVFLPNEQMRSDVREYVLGSLDDHWGPMFGRWQDWAKVYLAGSGASFWWDSDGDLDILLGVDLDRLRMSRPANREVSDIDIVSHLNKTLYDLRTSMADYRPDSQANPMEVTYFVNPGSYDIRRIIPYAAYDVTEDQWVVKPPVLPKDWGPDSIPEETWRRCEQVALEARATLSLPEPQRSEAGRKLFDWIHEGRRASYSAYGGGWLDFGNVCYQYLSQTPDRLLRRLYLCKHPEQATEADAIEKTAAGVVPQGLVDQFRESNLDVVTDPDQARDRCQTISEAFANLLRHHGIRAEVISGLQFGESPLFPGKRLVMAGHFAVLVDGQVYDWTARQFDPNANVPSISSEEIWRDTWKRLGAKVGWQQSQSRPHEVTKRMLDQCRKAAKALSLGEATTLTRKVLGDAGFPQADYAEAIRHPAGMGRSSVAWDTDTIPPTPLVALAYDMQDEFTTLHECAHIIRNGPAYAARQSDEDIAHDDQWFTTFARLLSWYAENKLWRQFQYVFGMVPSASATAARAEGHREGGRLAAVAP